METRPPDLARSQVACRLEDRTLHLSDRPADQVVRIGLRLRPRAGPRGALGLSVREHPIATIRRGWRRPPGPLINTVGELGVAVAQQRAAADEVTTAEERAREHLRRAQQEADRMVADARAQVATAGDGYRQAHDAAIAAGWSPAALTEMGYAAPAAAKRSRPQPPARAEQAEAAPMPAAEPGSQVA